MGGQYGDCTRYEGEVLRLFQQFWKIKLLQITCLGPNTTIADFADNVDPNDKDHYKGLIWIYCDCSLQVFNIF